MIIIIIFKIFFLWFYLNVHFYFRLQLQQTQVKNEVREREREQFILLRLEAAFIRSSGEKGLLSLSLSAWRHSRATTPFIHNDESCVLDRFNYRFMGKEKANSEKSLWHTAHILSAVIRNE